MEDRKTLIHSEIKQTLSSVSVTISDSRFKQKHVDSIEVEVESSVITVTDEDREVKFHLADIELSPLTCRGLKLSPFGELNFTMQIDSSSWKTVKPQIFDTKTTSQEEWLENVQLYHDKCFCTKCGHKLFTNHSFFKRVLPLPSDNWSAHTDMWFCHNHGDEDTDYKSISLLPKSQECFISSTYFLVRALHLSAKHLQDGTVICPRCRSKIGAKFTQKHKTVNGHVNNSEDSVCKIFHQAVIFHREDLYETTDSILVTSDEAFFAKIINEQSHMYTSFRLILTGEEGTKKIQCLIWLIDPKMLIFQGMASEEPCEVNLKPKSAMKLLYKCHMNGSASSSETVNSPMLDQWIKDNSVHSFQLPYTLCLNIVTSLVNSTKLLPRSQRSLNNFMLGYLRYDS